MNNPGQIIQLPPPNENHSCQSIERAIHPFRTTWTTRNNEKTLELPKGFIFNSLVGAAIVVS